jgi:hypothetical protein
MLKNRLRVLRDVGPGGSNKINSLDLPGNMLTQTNKKYLRDFYFIRNTLDNSFRRE